MSGSSASSVGDGASVRRAATLRRSAAVRALATVFARFVIAIVIGTASLALVIAPAARAGVAEWVDATSGPLGGAANGRGVAGGDYDGDAVNASVSVVEPAVERAAFVDVTADGPFGDMRNSIAAAWGDYDNDGDLDLYVVTRSLEPENKLFRNEGDGTFVDATSGPLGGTSSGSSACAWADYDNDGDLDLFLSAGAHSCGAGTCPDSRLFRNEGDGTFADATSGLGLTLFGGPSYSSAWGDYDNDGAVDLFVAFGTFHDLGANWLLRNLGDGTFTRAGGRAIRGEGRFPETEHDLAWADYDDDGDLDLYVASTGANHLYRNDGGFEFFADATSGPLGDTGSGGAVAWGDYDNDGDLDLYLANLGSANKLFRNDGGTFVDATSGPLGDTGRGTGVAWGDYDNDGDLDLVLGNFFPPGTSRVLRNEGDGAFVDATPDPMGNGFVDGVAWGDYDDDGDLDLFLVGLGGNKLLRNDTANGNHWLQVKLRGTASNWAGIGARVKVVAGGLTQIRELSSGSSQLLASFGLGGAATIDLLEVRWPSGTVQVESPAPPVDGVVTVVERSGFVNVAAGTPLGDRRGGLAGPAWGDYDDDGDLDLFASRSVIRGALFRNGGADGFEDVTGGTLGDLIATRGGAWGDYDNDGDLDLLASGLWRNEGDGAFADVTSVVGAGVWGDYDNDGNLDVYSGLLYRNQGDGTFVDVTAGALGDPPPGGSGVWGDYDDDGDLDLYLVGSGPNQLLRNDRGTFVDATNGPLGDPGSGRGVAWADFDNDGDLDLYLANNGTANKLFQNQGDGTFVDATSGPLGDAGRGVGVAWADFDNDGDLDLYLANQRADEDHPDEDHSNRLFRNEGGGAFVSFRGPLDERDSNSSGAAWGDYDNDGDLDLYLVNQGSPSRLFRNESATGNRWLQVRLQGAVSNRAGIGARVKVVTGALTQIREVSGGSGYRSQDALTASFGLGTATTIDLLEVRWPSGIVQEFTNLTGDPQRVIVDETGGLTPTLLSLFQASWTGEGIELRWQFGDPGRFAGAVLERAESSLGPWTPVSAERRELAGTVVLLDRAVEEGRTYHYRLVAALRDGGTLTFGPVAATAGEAVLAFGLESLAPNPSHGPVRVAFTVAREARVMLTVLDVQGRRVALLADGIHRPGRYQATWDGRTERAPAPTGLYLVRYEWPGMSVARRMVVIR